MSDHPCALATLALATLALATLALATLALATLALATLECDSPRYSGYVYDAVWLYARVIHAMIRKDKSLVQVGGHTPLLALPGLCSLLSLLSSVLSPLSAPATPLPPRPQVALARTFTPSEL